jgi:chemotaxis protein CheZ
MSKRPKQDESGDSDELQALFDSIAAQPAAIPVSQVKTPPPAAADSSGDNDELQALFDAVSAETGFLAEDEGETAGNESGAEPEGADPEQPAAVFNRLGHLTRQVHDTLRELGLEGALQEAAAAIPDARQRLSYIAQMTEQAASRVLNATDIARPVQDTMASRAEALRGRWDQVFAGALSPAEFRALSAETREFMGKVSEDSRMTSAQLLEIMMAQDFQDLTGQVIKKVVDLAQMLEGQLLQVLLEAAPAEVRSERNVGLLNGPVVNGAGRDDVVTTQGQVDDLLESLGF